MRISIVIPTYNRPAQISLVLDEILNSDVSGFENVEVIVVDDGSPKTVEPNVLSKSPDHPFQFSFIRQENAGPARARNNGFGLATNDIVLFIDDDILVLPDLIRKHWTAHQEMPRSVIFGRSPFVVPDPITVSYRYLLSLSSPATIGYEQVNVVASGNLSVERSMFLPNGVYCNDLQVPASEEFELEQRLNNLGIPIYIAHEAVGWHLQPSTIEDKCKQEFKYGVGAAEVWIKLPEIAKNEHVSSFVLENGYIDWSEDPTSRKVKKIVKSILAGRLARNSVLAVANRLERLKGSDRLLFPMYRFLCGINLFAGVREGLGTFGRRRS